MIPIPAVDIAVAAAAMVSFLLLSIYMLLPNELSISKPFRDL
jgi:hypothetical protein